MKPQLFSRKIRQFKAACNELETQIKAGTSNKAAHLNSLVIKIKKLAKELAQAFNWSYVKRAMGSAAFLLGVIFSSHLSAQHFIDPLEDPFSLDADGEFTVYPVLADLDADGDFDLLLFEYNRPSRYYENIGTASDPNFADPITNPFGVPSSYYDSVPSLADIDNDGDLDLFVGEYYGTLLFHENVGTASDPNFAPEVTNPFGFSELTGSYIISPTFADLDADGDLDMLIGNAIDYYNGEEFLFYRNIGTADAPSFEEPLTNPFGMETGANYGVAFPQLIDLDADGDLDLLVGNYYGSFNYQENIGTAAEPQLGPTQSNPFNLVDVLDNSAISFADLDDDGDTDLLVGQWGQYLIGEGTYTNTLEYFENVPELSVGEIDKLIEVSVFPNPSSDFITVESSETISQIELVDVLGRTATLISNITGSIDVSNLEDGNYMVKVTLNSGETGVTRFIKK